MNLKAPLKPGRSEVGLTVVIVVVVVGLACRLRDLWHLQRQQLAGHRRDFSLLENPESAPTLSIRFLISNFQWPTGEMWVTRQMAAHTGQHHRRSTMLLSITSSATLIDYWLRRMLLVESKWTIRDFFQSMMFVGEKIKRVARVWGRTWADPKSDFAGGHRGVALSDRLAEVSFSSWQKRMSSSDVPMGAYVSCRSGAFPIH